MSDRRGWTSSARLALLGAGLLTAARSPGLAGMPAAAEGRLGEAPVGAAAFSPDGKMILTAYGADVRLWDAAAGRELQRLAGHAAPVRAVAFSPDGRRAVTGAGAPGDMGVAAADTTARVWDVVTGRELRRLPHESLVYSAQFSPDGRRLVTATQGAEARLWDAETGRELARWAVESDRYPADGFLPALAAATFSPDGRQILGRRGRDAVLRDATTGAEIRRFEGHAGAVRSQGFSPDGRLVLTASADGTARAWDAGTGAPTRVFRGHRGPLNCAAFRGDGGAVVTASDDATARLWDPKTGAELRRFDHPGPVLDAAVSRDGRRVLATWEARDPLHRPAYHASLWDVDARREVVRLALRPPTAVALFGPGDRTFLASTDPTELRDAETGEPVRRPAR